MSGNANNINGLITYNGTKNVGVFLIRNQQDIMVEGLMI